MTISLPFKDRATAGRLLARVLTRMKVANPFVLALPRGGVPVASEVARALNAPLELLLVRKIGVPWQPELAAAAVVDGNPPDLILNEDVVALAELGHSTIRQLANREIAEIERRRKAYATGRPPAETGGRTVILVDDGIATATSVRAALTALKRRGAKRLILAVPVAPAETLAELAPQVDDIVCLAMPEPVGGIGAHYADFHQLADDEVISALAKARHSVDLERQ